MTEQTRMEQRFRAANPVPDPADPPMNAPAAATALLDLEERKGTMQTKEIPNEVAAPPKRPRRGLVAGVALAVVVAAGGFAWWIAPGSAPEEGPSASETAGAPTITFDGASLSCSYSGPAQFTLGEDSIFTGVNNSGVPLIMAVVALREGVNPDSVAGDQTRNPSLIVEETRAAISFPEDAADPTFNRLSLGVREGTVADDPGLWIVVCDSPRGSEGPQVHQVVDAFDVVGAG